MIAGFNGINNAIDPHPRCGIPHVGLLFVSLTDFSHNSLLLLLRYRFSLFFQGRNPNLRQNFSGLGPAHHRYLRRRPGVYESRIVSASAHGIVSSPVTVSHDNGYLGNRTVGDRIYHLCTILDDTSVLAPLADHKTGDIL